MKISTLWVALSVLALSAPMSAGEGGLPPGAEPYSESLEATLRKALKNKGREYRPRTEHFNEDGSPRFTNRLIQQSSPYLLQHAHNPVNWYPWGDEAFETARRLGRPVLLSIGYSTCHWCHVMERESFEDLEIATYLNEHYIAIKVDREERPDLDAIYMAAVQMLTGRGGWPMTTWLTPDREPFYGGTYFPPRDGVRGAKVGFLTILQQLKQTYDAEPEKIVGAASSLVSALRSRLESAAAAQIPGDELLQAAAAALRASFDEEYGGRRQQPKFPSGFPVRWVMAQADRAGDGELRRMAIETLRAMSNGGIHDQVGGGFHRYSVDRQWLVPHFEKMLYDNALLTQAYLDGYQLTGDEEFAGIARRTLEYVRREMTASTGGYYSATDADSLTPSGEMEEGWFFTWSRDELRALLGEARSSRVEAYYGVSPRGNFEGRTILNVRRPLAEVAQLLGTSEQELRSSLDESLAVLYRSRLKRPKPLLDDKILTSWNGLMIAAMARGGFVLDEPAFIDSAERAANFVLDQMIVDGRLRRSFGSGDKRPQGFLDDHAFLIAGLLELYEATSESRWLREAIGLQAALDARYAAPSGAYYMTGDDQESLLAREIPTRDGAEPSGNSVALLNLMRLHEWTTDDRYRQSAERLLRALAGTLAQSPTSQGELLLALDQWTTTGKQVVIAVAKGADPAPFLQLLRREYLPHRVLTVVYDTDPEREQHEGLVPWIAGKHGRKGGITAYVCEQGLCKWPTSELDEFATQLRPTRGTQVESSSETDEAGSASR